MPNLRQFIFTLLSSEQVSYYIDDLLNGHEWQQMLTTHVLHLKTFDFLMSLFSPPSLPDINDIIYSFKYFFVHYDGWHMTIKRSRLFTHSSGKITKDII